MVAAGQMQHAWWTYLREELFGNIWNQPGHDQFQHVFMQVDQVLMVGFNACCSILQKLCKGQMNATVTKLICKVKDIARFTKEMR